ncbi:MAG: hypothetical protein WB709_03925 [Solirubrobacteraceae bacterium]
MEAGIGIFGEHMTMAAGSRTYFPLRVSSVPANLVIGLKLQPPG